ncbi:MAG: hypothetical protein V4598_16765 [Bdellovibrionota bacterium]
MKWIFLLSLMGCAQITSLNLQKHQFGILPLRIVWFQVAGLEEEHVSMIRFREADGVRTSFEKNICMGKSWSYNLYQLRPNAKAGFLSQITGKKNISGSCEDASHRPIWSYLSESGYQSGVLEIGANTDRSIVSLNQCGEKGLTFLSNIYLWQRQQAPTGAATWHSSDVPLEQNKIFYDRTCGQKNCSSTIYEDTTAVYERLARHARRHVLIVRDFSYIEALEAKDFVKAREILADLERAYGYFVKMSNDSSESLVLLTTAESRFIDMPDQGKNWYEFEKTGAGANTKRVELMNMVVANGARAENFCGIYDDADVFERILSGPKQQGLELKIINPFRR